MPDDIDTDLSKIQVEAETLLKAEKGVPRCEIQPIAFGLKQLMITTTWPEEKDTEIAEKLIQAIPGVANADIIDYRRAIG